MSLSYSEAECGWLWNALPVHLSVVLPSTDTEAGATMVLSLKHLKKEAALRGCHLHLQVTNMRERAMIKPQAWSLSLQPSVTPSD